MLTKQSAKPDQTKSKRANNKGKKPSNHNTGKRASSSRVSRQQQRRNYKRPRRRIFPIWLRLIVVFLLAIGALLVGLMIGYGLLGDGVPRDALKLETWQHIIDIVTKPE